jgi:amino acid permease
MKTVERVVFGGKPLSQSRHVLSTLLFVSVTAAVAVFVPNISIVFSILGSTACTAITQIIPGLLFVAVSPGRLSSPHKLACIALVCAVTLVGGASIVQTIVNAAT